MLSILLLAILLITASLYDIKTFRIPNPLTLGGFLVLLIIFWIDNSSLPRDFIISSAVAFTFFTLFSLLSKGKLGMGDAKLSLSIGGVLGVYYWLISLSIASIVALFYAFFAIRCAKIKRDSPIPFAPFLSAGALAAYLMMKENLFAP